MTTQFKPELLSPAGSLKNMRYAFAYGADAVYAGQPRYSLRVRNNEFNHANLKIGIDEAHALGKKFYVVVNIAPHNSKLKTFIKDLQPVIDMGPDALIMSDPGLIMLVRENFPDIDIHLSVQANAVNWATVKFWKQMGLTRVILSRELSIEEIAEIRQHVPDIELEIFVHGALCMAYSGRCLLSGYINKRDPNQGTCTNACRWEYKMEEGTTDEVGNIVPKIDPAQQIEVKNVAPTLGEGAVTAFPLKRRLATLYPCLGVSTATRGLFLAIGVSNATSLPETKSLADPFSLLERSNTLAVAQPVPSPSTSDFQVRPPSPFATGRRALSYVVEPGLPANFTTLLGPAFSAVRASGSSIR